MERGMLGVLPRTPRLEDESYLDVMESVRNFAIREMFPRVAEQAASVVDRGPIPLRTLAAQADRLPLVGTWKRLMVSQQQRTWQKIRQSLHAEAATHLAALDAAAAVRPDRLHIRPDFVVPRYATLDIHLQPGGYVGDELAGLMFHHGTKVFYQGDNDQDQLHRQVVDMVRLPADGQVRRALDVACSIGQCTTALKQRLPEAEVWGLDVSAPLLRYAHKRAVDLDIDVHFVQALAEDTGLGGGEFDTVLVYILFHEVPEQLFAPILAELFRVLRPGGTLTIVDAPPGHDLPVGNRLWLEFDSRYNCEPYSLAFVACDLPALLHEAGFDRIESGPTPTYLHCTTAIRPAAGSS